MSPRRSTWAYSASSGLSAKTARIPWDGTRGGSLVVSALSTTRTPRSRSTVDASRVGPSGHAGTRCVAVVGTHLRHPHVGILQAVAGSDEVSLALVAALDGRPLEASSGCSYLEMT